MQNFSPVDSPTNIGKMHSTTNLDISIAKEISYIACLVVKTS